jgi:hypothetical protein
MRRNDHQKRAKNRSIIPVVAWIVLIGAMLAARPASAQTYVSAEPILSVQIVGKADLAKIEALDYSERALWSVRLLYDCGIVQNVITTLSDNKAITTIHPSNKDFQILRKENPNFSERNPSRMERNPNQNP